MRIEPDSKGLSEILHWMCLGVPAGKIDDVVPALQSRGIGVRVGRRRISEQLPIALTTVQAVKVVDSVACFMAKYPSALGLASAFDFEHLAAFQVHEAGMRKVEGNGKSKHAVWAEELFRQPDVRQDCDAARFQLPLEALDAPRHQTAFQLHRQVAETRRQQCSIGRIVEEDGWRMQPPRVEWLGVHIGVQKAGSAGAAACRACMVIRGRGLLKENAWPM